MECGTYSTSLSCNNTAEHESGNHGVLERCKNIPICRHDRMVLDGVALVSNHARQIQIAQRAAGSQSRGMSDGRSNTGFNLDTRNAADKSNHRKCGGQNRYPHSANKRNSTRHYGRSGLQYARCTTTKSSATRVSGTSQPKNVMSGRTSTRVA